MRGCYPSSQRHNFPNTRSMRRSIKSMPFTKCQIVLVCAVICNCIILFYVSHVQNINGEWLEQSRLAAIKNKIAFRGENKASQFESEVTIVFLEFEVFENDIGRTARSFREYFPNIHIVIISRRRPYPPLDLPNGENSAGCTRSIPGSKAVIWKTRELYYHTIRYVCAR